MCHHGRSKRPDLAVIAKSVNPGPSRNLILLDVLEGRPLLVHGGKACEVAVTAVTEHPTLVEPLIAPPHHIISRNLIQKVLSGVQKLYSGIQKV